MRVDRHSFRVVGFSIPNFTEWHKTHADEEGNFDVDLPEVWPMDADRHAGRLQLLVSPPVRRP